MQNVARNKSESKHTPEAQPIQVVCSLFKGISPAVREVRAPEAWAAFVGETLPELVASQAREKKRLPGFVLASVSGRRSDDTVGAHTALAIDVDALPDNDLAALLERAERFRCAVYETPSSTDEAPRVRVVAAIAEPLPPEAVQDARRALAEALGLDPDRCGTTGAIAASQVMFAGRLRGTRERGLWTFTGELWAPPAAAPTRRRSETRAPSPTQRAPRPVPAGAFDFGAVPDLSAIAKAVPPAGQDGDRHLLVRGLGGWLARRGYSDDAIAEAVRLQIPASDPEERASQAVGAAQRARAGLDAPGWEAISQWAERYGRRTTLARLERACRDPREPQGFGDVWSEWWARVWPKLAQRWSYRARGERTTALALRENAAAIASVAPGIDGIETDDKGAPLGTVDNIIRCVRHLFGHALALDTSTGQAVLTEAVRLPSNNDRDDVFDVGPWQDVYTVQVQAALNRMQMRHAYGGDTHNAVRVVAAARPIDVHGDWLRGLADQWDGTPRVDNALSTYWRATDDTLSRAVSRVMLLGIAARGLRPGCQLDTVPVLIGAQGCGKSQSLQALVWGDKRDAPAGLGYGAERRYCGSKLQIGHKDAMAVLRGHLVWELAELASVRRADVDEFKAYVTQRSDTFRPSHGREEVRYLRSVAFVATVNPEEGGHVIVNRDATGGRRWAPVRVAPDFDPVTRSGAVDVAGIERDREQLLGEAAARVLRGEQWHPTEAEAAALLPAVATVTEDPIRDDPWYQPIKAWARKQRKPFSNGEVFDPCTGAVQIEQARQSLADAKRAGKILRELGYSGCHTKRGTSWHRASG